MNLKENYCADWVKMNQEKIYIGLNKLEETYQYIKYFHLFRSLSLGIPQLVFKFLQQQPKGYRLSGLVGKDFCMI